MLCPPYWLHSWQPRFRIAFSELVISREGRSRIMRGVRSKNTSIELAVRRELFRTGYRYRLHYRNLPGTPDLVFPGRKKVIFIHGCFWHQHAHCGKAKFPATNQEYWLPKLRRNVERDRQNQSDLRKMGWKSFVIWECQLANLEKVVKKAVRFLEAE